MQTDVILNACLQQELVVDLEEQARDLSDPRCRGRGALELLQPAPDAHGRHLARAVHVLKTEGISNRESRANRASVRAESAAQLCCPRAQRDPRRVAIHPCPLKKLLHAVHE